MYKNIVKMYSYSSIENGWAEWLKHFFHLLVILVLRRKIEKDFMKENVGKT